MKKQSKKLTELLNKAQKKNDAQQWPEALELWLKAGRLDEDNAHILFQLGWIHIQLGQTPQALPYFARVEVRASNNVLILNWVAVAYMRLSQWAAALRVLQRAMALDESNIHTFLNFSGYYTNHGEHKKALDMSMKAVLVDVTNVSAHLNMGAALQGMGLLEEARVAFTTCILLQPDCLSAYLNLAVINSKQDKPEQAIKDFEKYFTLAETVGHDKVDVARYYLSYELLKTGQLKKGWALYDSGFDPAIPAYVARAPARQFSVPRWAGQPIPGQRLLVWAEQGLGDEILFLTCMRDVLATGADVILECAPRLVTVMARSFPTVNVRAAAFDPNNFNQSFFQDYDHHIPMGSLPGLYRQSVEDFQQSLPYVITDEETKNRFSRRLAGQEGKLKVGICWRSGLLTALRNHEYSAIKDWGELLQLPNCVFVNLQYGDCEAELAEVEAHFGISVLRWPDLDLKNDLDDVFALMACLDLVVTAGTAVNPMAGSLGKATLLIQPDWGWPNLGTDFYPWYPNTRCFVPSRGQLPASVMPQLAAFVAPISA